MFFNIFGSTVTAPEREAAPAPAAIPGVRSDELRSRAEAVDSLPAPVVMIDRDFVVQYMNQAAAGVVGRSADECVGVHCYELFRTPHCGTPDCACDRAMRTGQPTTAETVASPSGTGIPIRYTGSPMLDQAGNIIGAVEYVLDITQETRIAEDVERLAADALNGFLDVRADDASIGGNHGKILQGVNLIMGALSGHLDAMPTPAVIVDRDFTVRYLNDAAAAVVGLSADRARGQKCHDLFKAGDCRTARCALDRAMRTGEMAASETDAHPQGLDLNIAYSGVPIRNAAGEIVGAMEVVTDQTALKAAMREADEKVEFLNAVPTPVIVVDREYTVRFLNPAGASALGRSVEACISEKCYNLFNTGDCRTSNCAVSRAMQMDSVITSDTVAQLPSGPLPIRYTGRALKDEAGNIIGALEYVLDISKEMEITSELGSLADAASEGNLDFRADEQKFEGNYRSIVSGVNGMVDAFLEPIKEAAQVLARVAQRELDARMVGDYKGEHAVIKDNLNLAAENLDQALVQVAEAASQVTSASGQISAGSQSLAEGANEQASSLEEVSSSLEEMSSITGQNADSAAEANALAQAARGSAEQGNATMGRMSEAMDNIKSSSDETAKIIKTIDEIAFQTNLLALNAAVEAARAGEAGKGFAVVAEEVRNLARRSAEAAKVTADMIEGSQKNAEAGVKTASEVGGILAEIVTGTAKVNDITAEISSASVEQARGIEQVNIAISQMSKVTQQNAANAEESASAAEELSGQAEELMQMIGEFKLSGGNGHSQERGWRIAASLQQPAAPAVPLPVIATDAAAGDEGGNGGRKGSKKAPAKGKKALDPEKVIPLGKDDLDF